jgi:tetratricopeptide (TPR) repeat protein
LEAARNATDATRRAQWLAASEKTLTTALNLNPLNTDHSANLARMHRIMATLTDKPSERTEQLRLSSKFYDNAARLSPTTAYLRNEWSITLTQAGDYAGARTQLEKSLQIDPRFAQTPVFLGDVYRAEKDFAKAAAAYLRALELDPNALSESDGTLQAGAASVLILPEYASQAIAQYAKIEQVNPKSIQARYALSDLYKRAGKIDLARQELEAAAQIAPNDLIANLTLVNFLSEQGQVDAAVTAMKRVMELVPSSRSDYQRFADFNTSLQALQRDFQAVQKSPNDINARNTLALDWKARGQPQFALPEYQAIVRLAPNLYDAQKNLVLLNLQLDRIDDAQASLAAAIALSPDNEKPLWQNVQVAINAHKTAQWEQALKAAQDALNLAGAQDKPALQGYLTLLQGKAASK